MLAPQGFELYPHLLHHRISLGQYHLSFCQNCLSIREHLVLALALALLLGADGGVLVVQLQSLDHRRTRNADTLRYCEGNQTSVAIVRFGRAHRAG